MADIDKAKRELDIVFKVGKDATFRVTYARCSSNKEPDFSTSAKIFYPNHRSVKRAGQCQEYALEPGTEFRAFYDKWNPHHLHRLTGKQLDDLEHDIAQLKLTGTPFYEASDGTDENWCSRRSRDIIKEKPHKATRIKWDTDGATLKECGLPTSTIVPFGMDDDEVSDWLSDKFGYCHAGFSTNFADN